MAFLDRPEPAEHRHSERSAPLATGTLACPRCDAPVALAAGPHAPIEALWCPFCRHGARLRDFLSLAEPSRPARVTVRVSVKAAAARRTTFSER